MVSTSSTDAGGSTDVGGSTDAGGSTDLYTVLNPATAEPVTDVHLASLEEADALIDRAHEAFPAWRDVAPGERARLLRRFASVVDDHVEELAGLEVRNAGHTLGNARWEAGNVRDCLNYYSAAPERLFGRQIPVAGGIDVTFREPLGVVGIIVPWNFPMPIAGWGFAPALAAGNTVVLKPAELTPLTAIRLGELAIEAGLPEGVFTVIPGKGSVVGNRFVTHPLVRKVCFTGSTGVGKQIMAGCADQVKRVTLELGGKSANIVFADADVAKAAATAPYAVFDNAGQDCCARSRILVERSAYDEFLGRLETAVGGMRVSDPGSDPDSEMGPLISAQQKATVTGYLDGADVAFTGPVPDLGGFWVPPTVVLADDPALPVWREEIFGPVVAVMPFDDEADAVRLANDTEYGLSGSIYTRDVGRALRVARAVEAGNLSVNSHSAVRYWTPFGGFKQSGLGRELGPDAPNAFTEEKNVFFAQD
jgi:acyl-CoA reductase-like NAD-dependent aldehyde dehydrogenase